MAEQAARAEAALPSESGGSTDLENLRGDVEVSLGDVDTPSHTRTRAAQERPLYKLSVRLIDTYKLINKVYYENKARKTAHPTNEWDDENHDYLIHQGEVFAGRYEIKRRIGKARGVPRARARCSARGSV
jgi:hypothetical protein